MRNPFYISSKNIISQLGYDKFGQRTYLRYGNGTETEYSYEDNRRRLENMTAKSNTTYGSSVNRTFINNNYSYDILSNVLSVENTAALPTTGQIGGSVLYEYTYDDLNRLKTATGNFTGRNAKDTGHEYQRHALTMSYDNMHNILSKNQIHETSLDHTDWKKVHPTTYDLAYSYDANNKPHAPREIIDQPEANSTGNDVKTKLYDYDANGNMTTLTQKTGESDVVEKLRTNLWDEENRLRAVDITPDAEGVRPIAIYTYDAGGERVLKHSNTSVSIYLNGKKVADTIQVDATIYPSGMLVARLGNNGNEEEQTLAYTKHYYAGTQRVSSKIGTTENVGDYLYDWFTQGTGGPVDVIGSSFGVLENAEEGVIQVYDEFDLEPPAYDSNPVFIPVQSFTYGGNEVEQYFFHPDHLGSTSYITNLLGEVSQHIEYFAFGETFVEEHRSSNNSPYKFNGKELDEETGWYYYGARYYDPRISIWLSVDPLANVDYLMNDEAFINGEHNGGIYNSFNHNSYSYTYQNPVLYIDPNGKQAVTGAIIGAGVGAFTEYASIIAEKMFVGDMSFIEANQDINWKDGIDIGVGAAFGAASGVIDNGISRFAKWITKPRNQKIMVFLLEYGVSVAESVIKEGIKYATGEESDFSLSAILIGALAETGMGHLISDKFVKNAIKDADNSIARITRKLNNLSDRKSPNQKLINKERQKLEEAKSMKNMLKTIETGQEATSKASGAITKQKTKELIEQ